MNFVLIFLLFIFASVSAEQKNPIGSGALHVLGLDVSPDPTQQSVPINTATGVNTNIVFPQTDPALPSDQLPALPADYVITAELSGPGLATPKTISTTPGGMLMIPPLPQKGTYVLENIRLVSNGQVLLYADPQVAYIDTIEKLLITNVTSRALSIDEIEDLGITIGPENFTAYNFTVAFGTETGTVKLELPVVMDIKDPTAPPITTHAVTKKYPEAEMDAIPSMPPNFEMGGLNLMPEYEFPPGEPMPIIPPIAGVIVIPGDIAFLNQFFEVMLLVTNGAPRGTNLNVSDMSAEIFLPAGSDNVPGTPDDPLRVAETTNGAYSVEPVINQNGSGAIARNHTV